MAAAKPFAFDPANCGVNQGRTDKYDIGNRFTAMLIVWSLASLGCLIPLIGSRVSALKINEKLLQALMAFGVGVVIATALIHMIPPAINKLNSPCLGIDGNHESLAMAIVLATILLMTIVETELGVVQIAKSPPNAADKPGTIAKNAMAPSIAVIQDLEIAPSQAHDHGHGHSHGYPALQQDPQANSARHLISTIIFECGVYLHSILIGVNLGVLQGSNFTALLVALSFHQFFEGVAVGNLSSAHFHSLRAVVGSVVVFTLMTPMGILIGILVSSSYSPTSTSALWVQGSLDAVSGGILLYTGLIELLGSHFVTNASFQAQPSLPRFGCYLSLTLGAFAMVLIGQWG